MSDYKEEEESRYNQLVEETVRDLYKQDPQPKQKPERDREPEIPQEKHRQDIRQTT